MMNQNWDITVQKVASLIDGINHVKRIAEIANVKPQWARQSLEHMMYYGCIILTDIFQYSNIYAVKPEITKLFDHKSGLAQECSKYVAYSSVPEISIERVYALYCGFKYGLTVRDWMEEQQVASLHVDERRVISFGVIKGLIYRVHKYPILTHMTHENEVVPFLPSASEIVINKNTGMPIYPDIIPFLDGKHHYDEICTSLECSPQELDEQLGSNHSVDIMIPHEDSNHEETQWSKMFLDKSCLVVIISLICAQNTLAQSTLAIPNTKFPWKNTYPVDGSVLEPKPEWLTIVKDDPILKVSPNTLTPDGIIQNADPTGNNTHCNWSWGGCVQSTDIVHCTDTKIWGTSFDDGPYEITRTLLAYLKTIDVKVTFFVVGKQVINNPEILRLAYDEGHEIGIHTWDHKELTTVSNDMIISELKWTELAIQEVIGVAPRLMRPPRGDIDDRVRYIVQQMGYVPAMWSVDSQDWRITAGGQTEALLLSNVTQWAKDAPTLKEGGNSLMHDLNNVTVGAAIKALPILHPHVQLSPVGVCA
ncbi:chitin deacetylase, partial [Rhizopus stolonifer]